MQSVNAVVNLQSAVEESGVDLLLSSPGIRYFVVKCSTKTSTIEQE